MPPQRQPPPAQLDEPRRVRRPAPAPRARRRWPLILAVLVGLPLVLIGSCVALLGAGAKQLQDDRAGGTVALGQAFAYKSGLGLSVSVPVPHAVDNQFIVNPATEKAFAVNVRVQNDTDRPVGAALVSVNATVAGRPVERIFDDGAQLVSQDIAPGGALEFEARFKAPQDLVGDLQVAVTGDFNEPVFFTGTIS